MSNEAPITSRAAFFVGYLKMPGRLALFLWCLFPLLLGGAGGMAIALALSAPDPGTGARVGGRQTLTGVVQLDPYPMLRMPADETHEAPWLALLIRPGKNGAQGRLADLDGKTVAATGFFYERDGQRIFELAGNADAVQEVAPIDGFVPAGEQPIGAHDLLGEVVDPKCFLGAMHPGEGKPHMMCGNRCFFGGIPPMLAVRDEAGALTMVLLVTADGGASVAPFEEWTAQPARLQGEISRLDDLLIMRVADDGIAGL